MRPMIHPAASGAGPRETHAVHCPCTGVAVPAAECAEMQRLPDLVRAELERWLLIVNAVQPAAGMQSVLRSAAEVHGVSFGALRDRYYAAKREGWRGLIPGHLGAHTGLGVAAPAAECADVQRLPELVRAELERWLLIVNAVQPTAAGIHAALRSTAQAHGVSFCALRDRYYAARHEGWRGLVPKRLGRYGKLWRTR